MDIDGVFSGGGIKAFALVGAYEAMEENGLRLKRVAGTSAGAILAAFIIAGYRSDEIYSILSKLNPKELLDERKTFIPSPLMKWLLLYWRLGLYKGEKLECWIGQWLAKKKVNTFADIPPESLRVIASDLTNGRLVVIPDDLKKYGRDPRSFPIARAIRMSCSLPYFFEPVRLRTTNSSALIVDGGVLSNFPMWLFTTEKQKRPVLGVSLSYQFAEGHKNKINNAVQMFPSLFETMKNAHDARYISKQHAKNIIFIPTKETFVAEFDLTEEKRLQLMETGRKQATSFLKKWSY